MPRPYDVVLLTAELGPQGFQPWTTTTLPLIAEDAAAARAASRRTRQRHEGRRETGALAPAKKP